MKGVIGQGMDQAILIVCFAMLIAGVSILAPHHIQDMLVMYPGDPESLLGIVGINFVHAGMDHLISNLVGIVPLLFVLAMRHDKPWTIVLAVMVISGSLLWFFGRPWIGPHAGASITFYGLVSFLIITGLKVQTVPALAIAAGVAWYHGMSAIFGSMPFLEDYGVSWEGHLAGLVGGGAVALVDWT